MIKHIIKTNCILGALIFLMFALKLELHSDKVRKDYQTEARLVKFILTITSAYLLRYGFNYSK